MTSSRRRRGPDAFDVRVGGEDFVVLTLPATSSPPTHVDLTAAERDVVRDVLMGLSNAAIGRKRSRSPRTIANQIASIYRKLGISSRAELAARTLDGRE